VTIILYLMLLSSSPSQRDEAKNRPLFVFGVDNILSSSSETSNCT